MKEELEVCVVDDDQYYNTLVTRIIENVADEFHHHLNIHSYRDGSDCVKNMDFSPDLVFLDFYLSTDNDITQTGLDVLKKLKRKHPGTNIVFMSQVHDWDKFKGELIEEGAMDFIKKDDVLPDRIKEILNKMTKKIEKQ